MNANTHHDATVEDDVDSIRETLTTPQEKMLFQMMERKLSRLEAEYDSVVNAANERRAIDPLNLGPGLAEREARFAEILADIQSDSLSSNQVEQEEEDSTVKKPVIKVELDTEKVKKALSGFTLKAPPLSVEEFEAKLHKISQQQQEQGREQQKKNVFSQENDVFTSEEEEDEALMMNDDAYMTLDENDDVIAAKAMKKQKDGIGGDNLELNADEIRPGLWLGSEDAGLDAKVLQDHGITTVLIPAFTGHERHTPPPIHQGLFHYIIWPAIMDVPGFPIIWCFPTFTRAIHDALDKKEGVLLHCANGVSRSPAIAIAYLIEYEQLTYSEAVMEIRKHRNKISTSKFEEQLQLYQALNGKLPSASSSNHNDDPSVMLLHKRYSLKRQMKMNACLTQEMQTVWGKTKQSEV